MKKFPFNTEVYGDWLTDWSSPLVAIQGTAVFTNKGLQLSIHNKHKQLTFLYPVEKPLPNFLLNIKNAHDTNS